MLPNLLYHTPFHSPSPAVVYKDLPVDHVRIDLLYAEETRRTNAKLNGPPSDTHTYLLALQLALSWVEEEDIGPNSASRCVRACV